MRKLIGYYWLCTNCGRSGPPARKPDRAEPPCNCGSDFPHWIERREDFTAEDFKPATTPGGDE